MLISCRGSKLPTAIDLAMSDYKFTPDTITIPAGEAITLHVTNKGFVSHKFVIFKLGTTAGESFGHEDEVNIYWFFEVLPGHSDTATFTAPSEPGEYFVTCGIQHHLEAGMIGKLIVVAEP
jgi:plastocyanin